MPSPLAKSEGHGVISSSCLTEPSPNDGTNRCGLVAGPSRVRRPDPECWAPRVLDPDKWACLNLTSTLGQVVKCPQ
jgi:hypothetical protein